MFGKPKELTDQLNEHIATDLAIDDFFGDEAAVAEAVRVDALRQRIESVEQQIQSQFTSMAAYAQIAQEQVDLVRSESQHAVERSEQKMVGLIERERSDRLSGAGGSAPDVTARLDALDAQVADMRNNLQLCLSNQKALAEAITDLFAQSVPTPITTPAPAPVATPAAAPATPPAAPPAPVRATDDTFESFDAPDIATVEPMATPPAPAVAAGHHADPQIDPQIDGPIPGLALD